MPPVSCDGKRHAYRALVTTRPPSTVYTYDGDGNVIKIAYPNGTQTAYDYTHYWSGTDPTLTVTNTRGTTLLSTFVYTYNMQRQKVGAVETVLNPGEGSTTVTTVTWEYDAEGRLTDETWATTRGSRVIDSYSTIRD